MKRGVSFSALVPRLLVAALLLLALVAAFKWGQYAKQLAVRGLGRTAEVQSDRAAPQLAHARPFTFGDENSTAPWIELVSWSPRVFVFHNFITEADCDHIVEVGQSYVTKSQVQRARRGRV